jgi:SAM-dependent methyltransferase
MADDAEELLSVIQRSLADSSLKKLVLSKPASRSADQPTRIDIRPIRLKQQLLYQLTSRIGNQEFHRNLPAEELLAELQTQCGETFRDVFVRSAAGTWNARFKRRRGWQIQHTASSRQTFATAPETVEHDRSRKYLIPAGEKVPFLIETGIMSADGTVRKRHFAKFRQINRYVEFIDDIVDRLPADKTLRIVDFGCGKSYLTFATHYLLTQHRQRKVSIVGLDRRPDVVETCRGIVERVGLKGIQFHIGDIAGYEPDQHVHLAISLHACDTATDEALAKAVEWKSEVILAVPCCQHELAASMPHDVQPVISRHGILHERFAALATDALRAAWLETVGYSAGVMEFIDMEHTAKNLLIRAVRRATSSADNTEQLQQIRSFCETFSIPQLTLPQRLQAASLLPDDADAD